MTKAAMLRFLRDLPDETMIFVHSLDDYLIGCQLSLVDNDGTGEPAFVVIEGRAYHD